VGAGWHLYDQPETGNASLDDVVAPGRDDAWAVGATINLTSAGRSAASSSGLQRWRAAAGSFAPERLRHAAAQDGGCEDVEVGLDSLMLHWDGHACGVGAGPFGRADRAAYRTKKPADPSSHRLRTVLRGRAQGRQQTQPASAPRGSGGRRLLS
jgi:hypothetical protein